MWAARNGNDELVHRLVEGGADVKLTNGDGSSAMMLAIANDRFDMAATLLELGADANDGSLFYAVEMRDAPTDWRARDGSRLRADHVNRLNSLDLIERLLAAGADPNKPYTGQMHSASMCCDTKENGTPFFRADSIALPQRLATAGIMLRSWPESPMAPPAYTAPSCMSITTRAVVAGSSNSCRVSRTFGSVIIFM